MRKDLLFRIFMVLFVLASIAFALVLWAGKDENLKTLTSCIWTLSFGLFIGAAQLNKLQ